MHSLHTDQLNLSWGIFYFLYRFGDRSWHEITLFMYLYTVYIFPYLKRRPFNLHNVISVSKHHWVLNIEIMKDLCQIKHIWMYLCLEDRSTETETLWLSMGLTDTPTKFNWKLASSLYVTCACTKVTGLRQHENENQLCCWTEQL